MSNYFTFQGLGDRRVVPQYSHPPRILVGLSTMCSRSLKNIYIITCVTQETPLACVERGGGGGGV